MSNDDRVDTVHFLESELERLLTWVRAAESRVQLVLPLSTALLGSLVAFAPKTLSEWSPPEYIAVALSVGFLVRAVYSTWHATFPKTEGPKGSLIFFGTIVNKSLSQYSSSVKNLTKSEYVDDLIEQCFRNAEIANEKFSWTSSSMRALYWGAITWAFSVGSFVLL